MYSVSNIEEILSYLLLGYRTPRGGGGGGGGGGAPPAAAGGGGGGGGVGYSPIWPIRECAAAAGQGMFFTSLS